MVKRLARGLALGFFLLSGAGLVAEPTLFELSGKWQSTGTIRPEPDQPAQEGRCRMEVTTLVEGQELRMKGRCATQAGSTALTMQFALRDRGVIAGAVASPSLPESVQYLGRIDGNTANLQSREAQVIGDQKGLSRFSLTVLDDTSFAFTQWFVPGESEEVIETVHMNFVRLADN